MRFSWKAIVAGVTATALFASVTALGSGVASAQPTPPARFFGTATVNGQPAASGTAVQATIGGKVCGSGSVSSGGSYVVDVASGTTEPGCGTNGATVSFTVGGAAASETGTWQQGAFIQLNLTAAAATATPSPTAAPTRTATPSPTRTATATVTRTVTATRTATAVRTPTVVATAQKPSAQAPAQKPASPVAQKPSAQAPAAAAPAQAPARLPSTGAALESGSGVSAGWALFGFALAAIALGAGGVMASRKSR
jgi:hypothetical protein